MHHLGVISTLLSPKSIPLTSIALVSNHLLPFPYPTSDGCEETRAAKNVIN